MKTKKILLIQLFITLLLGLLACEDSERVEIESCEGYYAYIVSDPNHECSNESQRPYIYEGDYLTWLIEKNWNPNDTFIIVLESCDREIYYGRFIKQFID